MNFLITLCIQEIKICKKYFFYLHFFEQVSLFLTSSFYAIYFDYLYFFCIVLRFRNMKNDFSLKIRYRLITI